MVPHRVHPQRASACGIAHVAKTCYCAKLHCTTCISMLYIYVCVGGGIQLCNHSVKAGREGAGLRGKVVLLLLKVDGDCNQQ